MQDNLQSMAPVSSLDVADRSEFIWKCYAHVVGAILSLAAIETYLFQSGVAWAIAEPMIGSPFIVLMAFIGLSWGASHFAHRLESKPAQYAAFAVFVVVWALMFVPMLAMALLMDTIWQHDSKRRRRDGLWLCRFDRDRDDHTQGFLVPSRRSGLGIFHCNGTDRRIILVWLESRDLVLCRHDRFRGCGRAL